MIFLIKTLIFLIKTTIFLQKNIFKKLIFLIKTKIKNLKKFKNITISKFGKHLNDDLENCHAVVNHNSSSIVGSIIKGYPAFITDPITSQCREVSHTDFKFIDIPQKFDRYGWLQRISMFHWKFDELEDGTCWKHMRQYINS